MSICAFARRAVFVRYAESLPRTPRSYACHIDIDCPSIIYSIIIHHDEARSAASRELQRYVMSERTQVRVRQYARYVMI